MRRALIAALALPLVMAAPAAAAEQDCGEATVCAQVAPLEDTQVGPALDRVFDDVFGEFHLF